MKFAVNELYAYILGAVLLASAGYYIFRALVISKNAEKYFDFHTSKKMGVRFSFAAAVVKYTLLAAALALIFTAFLRPLGEPVTKEREYRGRDIMVLLDVSSSMAAFDIEPNRMDAVKRGLKEMLFGLSGDRIGMIVFAGTTFVQCPLTLDYDAFELILDSVYPGMLEKDGTAIGDAVKEAVKRMEEKAEKSRAIILISDGENNAGSSPAEAARLAAQKDIIIYTAGAGTEKGSRIPEGRDAFGRVYYKTYRGEVVISKLDDRELKQIAAASGGRHYSIRDRNVFKSIAAEIAKMDENKAALKKEEIYEENYVPWLLAGIILLLLSGAVKISYKL